MTQRTIPPAITDRQAFAALAEAFGHLTLDNARLRRRMLADGLNPDEKDESDEQTI